MAFEDPNKPKLEELPTSEITLQITLRHDLQLDRAEELIGTVVDILIEDNLPDALSDHIWGSTFYSAKEKERIAEVDPTITDIETVLVDSHPTEEQAADV